MPHRAPPYDGYPPNWPAHGPGHDSLALGTTLGQLLAGQDRMIFLHERVIQELRELPERIAERMPQPDPPPSPPTLQERLKIVRDIIQTLIPLALLTAIVLGKLTWIETWPMIRQLLGLGGH